MSALSDKVLQIAVGYLGPAAQTFMERQATSHLGGLSFADLQPSHLSELANWVEISAGLIIDKAKATELAAMIKSAG